MCAVGKIVISNKHTSTQWGMQNQEEGIYKFHVDLTHYFPLLLVFKFMFYF
jgi:hypothetical protein